MTGSDDEETMDVLKSVDIKIEGEEVKLDDIGELVKQLGEKGVGNLDEKL